MNEWTLLASTAVWLLLFLLALLQWRPALKPIIRGYIVALGIAAVLTCGGLAAGLYQIRFQPLAVVVTRDAVVHNGPFDESPNAFAVQDGAELEILDRKSEWLQVSDARRIGWLRRDQVLIAP